MKPLNKRKVDTQDALDAPKKKLVLNRTTLGVLSGEQLDGVAGGGMPASTYPQYQQNQK